MARKQSGQQANVNRLIRRNLTKKIADFDKRFIECPNEIEVEGEDGKKTKQVCGCTLWDKRPFYQIYHVPQVVCQRPGGATSTVQHDYFCCFRCGMILDPVAWKKLAREAFEAKEKKIIVPDTIKPEGNGDNKEKEKLNA